jgi:hypothetical protein
MSDTQSPTISHHPISGGATVVRPCAFPASGFDSTCAICASLNGFVPTAPTAQVPTPSSRPEAGAEVSVTEHVEAYRTFGGAIIARLVEEDAPLCRIKAGDTKYAGAIAKALSALVEGDDGEEMTG